MIWYVGLVAILNLGLGYVLALFLGVGRGRSRSASPAFEMNSDSYDSYDDSGEYESDDSYEEVADECELESAIAG